MKSNEYTTCFYCGYEFTLLEDRYHVSKSVKPKGSPYRWKKVGHACVSCIDLGKECQIEVIK